jgi:hypothetical protein
MKKKYFFLKYIEKYTDTTAFTVEKHTAISAELSNKACCHIRKARLRCPKSGIFWLLSLN